MSDEMDEWPKMFSTVENRLILILSEPAHIIIRKQGCKRKPKKGSNDGSSGRARVPACGLFRRKANSDLPSKTAPRPRGAKRVDEACCNSQQFLERRLPKPDCLSRMS